MKSLILLFLIMLSPLAYAESDVERALQIGSPVASGTQSSVLFIGPGGAISQDNNSISYDDTRNSLSNSGRTTYPLSTVQIINAVGDTISADATYVLISGDAPRTLTSTPTIPDGLEGQIVIITCISYDSTTVNGVTLQDNAGITGTGLRLGASTRLISWDDNLVLIYSGVEWNEISFVAN